MGTYDYTKPFEGEERIVEAADGASLRTISAGAGDRPVLLAHGFGSAGDAWSLVVPMLVEQGHRVVAFDQRGHGASTIGASGVGSAQMASDYAAVLEAYDLTNTTLVGHSMGGFVSIAFMVDGPSDAVDRIGSLLLMGTFAGDVSRKNPQNKLQIPMIKSGVLQKLVGIGPVATAFTKSLVGDGFEPGMVDAFVPTFLQADHPNLIPILEAMVNENRYDRIGEITIPTTVLVGEKDKTTPAFHTEDLHRGIAGSKLVRLPGIGHGLIWEAPDAIASEIVELAERSAASAS